MKWLRTKKKLPELLIDTIAPVLRYSTILLGLLFFSLNISTTLGIYESTSLYVPSIIAASIIVIITWFSYQVVKYIFSWLRIQRRIPPDIVNVVELITRYSIILLGFTFLVLNVLATIVGADLILSFILGWFSVHGGELVLIVVAIIFLRVISSFLGRFFENLKMRTSLQPDVIDLAQTGTRALIYLVVGLMVLSSILTLIGTEELLPLLTSVFSVLFGIGFSFAAAGAIGNLIAGLVLSKWKPYTVGDHVEIGNNVYGDVMMFDILYTKIKTIKEEVISVPNLSVLMNKVLNYSYLGACIVHSKISIGYDYDRKIVETLLIKAALKTEDILSEPKPFVLISELASYSIVYEINAYSDQPNRLSTIYSNLHKNILDTFKEAQITILSPQFLSVAFPEKETP
jgi:small-conductance mechanosensitive channel